MSPAEKKSLPLPKNGPLQFPWRIFQLGDNLFYFNYPFTSHFITEMHIPFNKNSNFLRLCHLFSWWVSVVLPEKELIFWFNVQAEKKTNSSKKISIPENAVENGDGKKKALM